MHHQIVRRAGAERETLWVALAAGAILVSAALAVGLRAAPETEAPLAAHLVDSRTGLTAAEQGLYADLKAAGEEIAALRTAAGRAPTPEELAAGALPPFAADSSAAARGGHTWTLTGTLTGTLTETGDGIAYAGVSAAPELAGSLVLRLDGHGADIWLKRAAEAPPAPPEDTALAAAGWKRIVSTFTAGVTR
ncbi:hypothetical protein TSH58p_01490 (plasmid) [Azospirillum sp. TSH58]|uniref:DUF6162 family protein n=1 Tax=Azospirillum sp. TSH58 TaxID=664962 RepID=UPI000D601BC2|nr:DUF6162 family protein [Azospirillum sp. TSH58]AWJ82236.1 hypothetical protein TSH58p_01490 [Azospirillum sp. TSH58]PWC73717.1 hypothetical protein TSH58_03435 [Azospirillum sp. TSH58]